MIVLPWPDKRLSPNARQHWAALAKVKRDARSAAHYMAKAALPSEIVKACTIHEGKIPIEVRFYPPDARHRDDDNMVAMFKAWRDGIADALGVDDRRFQPVYRFMEPVKNGKVEFEVCLSAISPAAH